MDRLHRHRAVRRTALSLTLGLCLASGVAFAQSNTGGAVFGQASGGDVIVIQNTATGFTREVTVGADGSYRAGQLPSGTYTITRRGADGRAEVREAVTVNAGSATSVVFAAAGAQDLEGVTVTASGLVNPIDVSSVESTTILTERQLDRLPVARNTTDVALLAPGTVRADGRFGNVASFGGASAAENVYYINGFNVTNIVTGLAFNQVPFEGVAEQQVKTGGYGAEFGRSLGGVVNITTKSGTNEWRFGVNAFWTPDALASGTRLAFDPQRDGSYDVVETDSKTDRLVYNVYAGGPLVEDRLFFFGLFQGQDTSTEAEGIGFTDISTSDSPLGLVKLDWNIGDNHRVEFTAFRDRTTTSGTAYSESGSQVLGSSQFNGTFGSETGGDNYIAKWTGYLTDTFTLSALVGRGEYSRSATDSNSANCPLVIDVRNTGTIQPFPTVGCYVNTTVGDPGAGDTRDSIRIDGEWAIGDHLLRFGVDREEFETVDGTTYSGGIYWRYLNTSGGATLPNGGVVPAGVTEIVRLRYFENGGTFLTKNQAWYIEDTWQVTDNFVAYLGIRNEAFENLNSLGGTFIDIDNQWAPRLGMSWDVRGDSSLKVFANAGRYFIPVYANTNVRLAGAELDYQEFYQFTGIDPVTGAPTLGPQIGGRVVVSDGQVPDPRTVVDNDLDPMYQDEFILGAQVQLGELWSVGARGIRRELGSGMDDICTGEGAEAWALANGYTAPQAAAIYDALEHCFLTNPGQDLSANVDLDGTGELTVVNIPGSAIGLPEATRSYNAVEIFFERAWDERWFLQGSYTWAHSYGNTEGYVKSDNGQDDAGITQDFDYPGLADGSYGDLPNDRRHSLKLFGAYQIADEWRVGANLLAQSGRPRNCFGVYPADGPDQTAPLYGVASFYCGTDVADAYPGTLVPRGTAGRVGWVYTLDLQLAYEPEWQEGLSFRMDVRNVFDSEDNYRVIETFEDEGRAPAYNYGYPTGFVAPRAVTFAVQYEW